MLTVNQQSPANYTPAFTAKNIRISDEMIPPKKNNNLTASLLGLAAIGTATVAGYMTKQSKSKAFEKAGIEVKDGLAFVKKTGEKFTGSVKRNISSFGLKKEVVNFQNGMLTEILNYGFNGKELNGSFYKNGKLLYTSTTPTSGKDRRFFAYYKYDDKGKSLLCDGFLKKGESVFEIMRNLVKNEK